MPQGPSSEQSIQVLTITLFVINVMENSQVYEEE